MEVENLQQISPTTVSISADTKRQILNELDKGMRKIENLRYVVVQESENDFSLAVFRNEIQEICVHLCNSICYVQPSKYLDMFEDLMMQTKEKTLTLHSVLLESETKVEFVTSNFGLAND